MAIVVFMWGFLSYFTTTHPIIEARAGAQIAWSIVGVMGTLMIIAAVCYFGGLASSRTGQKR